MFNLKTHPFISDVFFYYLKGFESILKFDTYDLKQ